ncbi:hypothetical protein TDMWS_20430 [Thermodesulfomicrobium sp. WS]|uniref:EscI/YscI/HrpB family type III secretion system inner rod protein n=1 Tax=Thermodesulfomicrobium sp. WS TaxID=3004129 RepID=UPI002490AF78|nr:EscI/YscI/HrpB family type III secretion system inner rod protein [Thermodesulfomicrobium sp. WS]BDV01958.1 hypothetical protein TDMWS_20430 [Thermodesulfomicrobium sp. WS]
MIESLQTKQVMEQGIQEASTSQMAPEKTPDEQDVHHFEAALADPPTENIPSPTPSYSSDQVSSPGDRILQSLDAQRESFHSHLSNIDAALSGPLGGKEVSPAELLGLQWKLQQATVELELSTKVVEKGNEGVSTLLKNQG